MDCAGTLILDGKAVRRLLPMTACIEAMERALATLARQEAVQPLRIAMRVPGGRGMLGLMHGYLGDPVALGIKIVTVFPGNHGTALDAHQGVVLLFDALDGRLLAAMDASAITAIRTAAVSAVATRHLAVLGAACLCILGSGIQAAAHLEAMLLVRPIDRVRIWSRNADHARRLAEAAARRHGRPVVVAPSAREAVEGADVICTVTAAREPILAGRWIAPGAHVNAVGACVRDARELDTPAVSQARLFVDRRESALAEAGDFLIPKAEGAIGDDHILAELGEVVTGSAAGRTSPRDRTVFKSLGLAVEDLAAAHHILAAARASDDASLCLEIGGRREGA